MTTFNGRRAQHVSQYIANLNSLEPNPVVSPMEDYSFTDDLNLFTTMDFIDFDVVHATQENVDFDSPREERGRSLRSAGSFQESTPDAFSPVADQFPFSEMNPYIPVSDAPSYPAAIQNSPFPIQPALPSAAGSPSAKAASATSVPAKRPISATHSPSATLDLETQTRLAAEEDKRRRNTAASARFRIKKKMREQEMERTAKEMTEKAGILEARVKHLEMENEWLRSLIVDKYGKVPQRSDEAAEDKAALKKEKDARLEDGKREHPSKKKKAH